MYDSWAELRPVANFTVCHIVGRLTTAKEVPICQIVNRRTKVVAETALGLHSCRKTQPFNPWPKGQAVTSLHNPASRPRVKRFKILNGVALRGFHQIVRIRSARADGKSPSS